MTNFSPSTTSTSLCQSFPFSHELPLKSLQLQFENGVRQMSLGDGARASIYFDQVIQEINSKLLVTTLLHRAAAYRLQGKRDLALQDTYNSIYHAPTLSDGYIYAYHLLVSSNRFREALIGIVEGLKRVNRVDAKYAAMQYIRDALLAEIDKKNSLPLPYDVITDILHCLDFRDRVCLASTCKFWQRVLRDSPSIMWRNIDVRLPMSIKQFQHLLGHVESYHVRQIKVDSYQMIKKIDRIKWRHIECLETENVYHDNVSLRHVLERNKETLKELSIFGILTQLDYTPIFVRNVTSTCSNLTHLTIHVNGYKEHQIFPFPGLAEAQALTGEEQEFDELGYPRQQIQQLQQPIVPLNQKILSLIYLNTTEVRHLSSILPYYCNLRYIELLEQSLLLGHPPNIFSVIDQWCPNLIRLRYSSLRMLSLRRFFPRNDLTLPSLYKDYINNKANTSALTKKGLRELIYTPLDVVDVGISATIQKNIHTLQHLRLNTTVIRSQGVELQRALSSSVNTPNTLREIEFHGRRTISFNSLSAAEPFSQQNLIRDIIRAGPSLVSVCIRDMSIHDDDVFFAMGDLRKLRRVALIRAPFGEHKCRHNKSIFQCGLQYMFTNTRTLEEFYVYGISNLEPVRDYLYAMTKHKGLRSIHFKGTNDIKVEDTHIIAHILTELRSLTIESQRDVMFSSINYLHLLPKLESLTLRGINVFNMTDQIVYTLFQKRRDLWATTDSSPPVLQVSVYHSSTQKNEKYCSTSEEEIKNVTEQKRGGGQQKKRTVDAKGNVFVTTYYHDSRMLYENEAHRVIGAISLDSRVIMSDAIRRR